MTGAGDLVHAAPALARRPGQRFNARVVSLFGALSGALALQGLYGLLAAGALACAVPALRAARLDPAAILREP